MIFASMLALKCCAVSLVASWAGLFVASWMHHRTPRNSFLEMIVGGYVVSFYVLFVSSLIVLPIVALLNLLRVGGLL